MSIAQTAENQDLPNPLAPEIVECPFHAYQRLRDVAPVHYVEQGQFFLVSTYALCSEANSKPEIFTNDFQPLLMPKPEVAEIYAQGPFSMTEKTLLTNDPPSHTEFRSLVDTVFAPARVKKMEGYIAQIVDELIDGFIDDGAVELITQFAIPLPMSIIADQLGVPRSDMADFKRWSDASVVPFSGLASLEEEKDAAHQMVEFGHYFEKKLAEKRANPSDDIISDLSVAVLESKDRPLTLSEFLSIVQQVLTAGNETTTNTIACAMHNLIQNPDQLALIAAEPAKYARNATEETLRIEAPVQGQWRIVKQDTELGGVAIPAGSVVNLRYGSANRDPALFPDPDRFDITRKNAMKNLSFGQGIHHCVGANLARKEVTIALTHLFSRCTNWRFAAGKNDFSHIPSFTLRGLKALHLEFDRA